MERVRRFAGLAKGAAPAAAGPVRRDEDESLVLFGELYRHEKEKDVNLLEPMFCVEFEAIQGDGRMFKLPSGKRDYILPDGDKNDYDWLKTPPATPLFPSLEMEANSSQMIFQKELPILQPVKTSRFWSKPDSTSSTTSTRSESPTSSSSKSVTPTARPGSSSSSKKSLAKAAPATSREQDSSSYRMDKRSSYTPLTNRQLHTAAVPAAARSTAKTTVVKASKKASGNRAAAGSDNNTMNAVKTNVAKPDKAPRQVAAPAPKARSSDSAAGAKNLKADAGTARRLSRPPPATGGGNGEGVQDTVATKAKGTGVGTGAVPATGKSAGGSEATAKGRRRAGGEKEQRPKLGSHAKK